jgi:hypothetical protein
MAIFESADGIRIETDDNATDAQIQAIFNAERQQGAARQAAPQSVTPAYNDPVIDAFKNKPAPTMLQRMGNAVAPVADAIQPYVKPAMQTIGAIGGGLVGAFGGPAGVVAGSGLGLAAGGQMGNLLNQMGGYEQPKGLLDTGMEIGTDVATGMAGELAGPALAMAGRPIANLAGRMMPKAKAALGGSDEFINAMRGKVSSDQIADIAQGGILNIKNARGAAYREGLKNLDDTTTISRELIDNSLADAMGKYGVTIKAGKNGKEIIDVSQAAVGPSGERTLRKAVELVRGWDDTTPLGLDTLKKKLGAFYSEGSSASPFVLELKQGVTKTLLDNVPEYASMTKGYKEASDILKQMRTVVSKSQDADVVVKKLMKAMDSDSETKQMLISELTKQTGTDLEKMAAGYAMKNWAPKILKSPIGQGMAGATGIGTLFAGVSPAYVAAIGAASPRLRGELLLKLGQAARGVNKEAALRTGGILARNPELMGGNEE